MTNVVVESVASSAFDIATILLSSLKFDLQSIVSSKRKQELHNNLRTQTK